MTPTKRRRGDTKREYLTTDPRHPQNRKPVDPVAELRKAIAYMKEGK